MLAGDTASLGRVLVVDDSLTILKVVGKILALHGYESIAARDGIEALQQIDQHGPFDLVLLDFVMPRMNGYQFCRHLRADPVRAEMPVVLMSARTETIGDRFVEQTGAADAIAKPFDARALVVLVGEVLRKSRSHTGRRPPPLESMLDEEELILDPDEVEEVTYSPAAEESRQELAASIARAVMQLDPADLAVAQRVQRAVAEALEQNVLTAVTGLGAVADEPTVDHKVILEGRSPDMPLAEILQMLQLQRHTGVMRVRHKDRSVTVALRDGMIDLVTSEGTGAEFRIGRYFVEKGVFTRDELEAVIEGLGGTRPLGEALVATGKIDEETLRRALAKQSSELIYELMRWPEARFQLCTEPSPAVATDASLGLGISALVLEGFRRVDEWRIMEKAIEFDHVLTIDANALGAVDATKIGKDERALLDIVDGRRSVQDVVKLCNLASFDAIRIVYGLLQSRIVRSKARRKDA